MQESVPKKPVLLIEGPSWPRLDFTCPSSKDNEPDHKLHETTFTGESESKRFCILDVPIYLYPSSEQTEQSYHSSDIHELSQDAAVRTAGTVWDGSIILAKCLEYNSQIRSKSNAIPADSRDIAPLLNLHGKRVIELGAGRGLVGLSAACLGSLVTLTDVETVLPQLHQSVSLNAKESNSFMGHIKDISAVDWKAQNKWEEPFDVILGADIIWIPELVEPLVNTMLGLFASNPSTYMILAHQTRATRTDDIFFSLLDQNGLGIQNLGTEYLDPIFRNDKVNLYLIRRKR